GLNLTWVVRDGIVSHSKSEVAVLGKDWGEVGTLEGEVVKISDMVAYINHDIGDAVRAGILTESDLPRAAVKVLGNSHSQRINTMVTDIVQSSWDARVSDIIKERPAIKMSPNVLAAAEKLRDFLFTRVYTPSTERADATDAKNVILFLWRYFNEHEDKLPAEYRRHADTTERGVVDYIAGMTDQYATNLAEELKE
ncbi:MAG: deoxyguanosinetriphosphate triphosphohydrolase, partial [Dehalococcoidales bacterium]